MFSRDPLSNENKLAKKTYPIMKGGSDDRKNSKGGYTNGVPIKKVTK